MPDGVPSSFALPQEASWSFLPTKPNGCERRCSTELDTTRQLRTVGLRLATKPNTRAGQRGPYKNTSFGTA